MNLSTIKQLDDLGKLTKQYLIIL